MNNKKYFISAGIIATILVGASSLVFAEMSVDSNAKINMSVDSMANRKQSMVLEIGPSGKTLLRGTISSVGSSFLIVKSWGGDWTVNISTSTKILPGSDMSQFKAGDFVGVNGTTRQDAVWTVDATLVRNWTVKMVEKENKEMTKKERRNNEREIKEVIKNESPKNWQGSVSNINVDAKSFALTVDGSVYTVNLVADAKIVSKTFLTINFVDVKNGDTVRVWGPISGTTISAYVFRDLNK